MTPWPFATITLKINNICCDDMQAAFNEGKLQFDPITHYFGLDDKMIDRCPWCGRTLWINFDAHRNIDKL